MPTSILVLLNVVTGRYHPCLFRDRPFPGPFSPDVPVRLESVGHHTIGFDTLEEAQASAATTGVEHGLSYVSAPIEWDGQPGITILVGSGGLVLA